MQYEMEEDADAFWSVALDDTHRHSESLGSLVPSREDEVRFGQSSERGRPFTRTMHLKKSPFVIHEQGCEIETREQRAEGVFDLIGGEMWEACLLLSAYILLNPQKFFGNHAKTLELGCGIGLPSLLLAEMIALH